jgi:hypothetical protein
LVFGFFAAGFLDLDACDDEGFFFLGARRGSSAAVSSASSSLASLISSTSSGDSFSASSSSCSAFRLRFAAAGASGVNLAGAFETRPERRVVEVGAGELVALLSEVSMSGCRLDNITFVARGYAGRGRGRRVGRCWQLQLTRREWASKSPDYFGGLPPTLVQRTMTHSKYSGIVTIVRTSAVTGVFQTQQHLRKR